MCCWAVTGVPLGPMVVTVVIAMVVTMVIAVVVTMVIAVVIAVVMVIVRPTRTHIGPNLWCCTFVFCNAAITHVAWWT